MLPSYQELNVMSEQLRKSVVYTLALEEKEQVFIGNEEKLFLFSLFQNMPDSDHPTSVKIRDYKNLTYFRMIDIWSGEISKKTFFS